MKKYVVSVAVAAVLVVAAFIWWPQRKVKSTEIVVDAVPLRESSKPEEPAPIVAAVPPLEPVKEVSALATEARKKIFESSSNQNNTGTYNKIVSDDFKAYLEFVSMALAGEVGADGKVDKARLDYYKFAYQLSEEEVTKLSDFSRSVIEADRKFQAQGQRAICDEKSQPRSVYDLGVALNDFTAKVEQHQEALAHKAQLGSEPVFRKVFDSIRKQPQREVTKADFTILLVAQNRDLDTEIKRFCSVVTDVDAVPAK